MHLVKQVDLVALVARQINIVRNLKLLSIINIYTATDINPSLVRGETLSGIASIALISIGYLWTEINPKKPTKANLKGKEAFDLNIDLPEATAAASVHKILTSVKIVPAGCFTWTSTSAAVDGNTASDDLRTCLAEPIFTKFFL